MKVEAVITAPPDTASYGENYQLTCRINPKEAKPSLTHPLLQKYLTVDWLGVDNTTMESIWVGETTSDFSRTLYFKPLMEGDDRLYRCRATLRFPGKPEVIHTSQYRIMLGKYYSHTLLTIVLLLR